MELMDQNQADFTNTFWALSNGTMQDEPLFQNADFLEWHKTWKARKPDLKLMRTRNPAVIPRNHLVEKALAAAVGSGDYTVAKQLLSVLENPFIPPENPEYMKPSDDGGESYKTFCGT